MEHSLRQPSGAALAAHCPHREQSSAVAAGVVLRGALHSHPTAGVTYIFGAEGTEGTRSTSSMHASSWRPIPSQETRVTGASLKHGSNMRHSCQRCTSGELKSALGWFLAA